MKKLLSIAAVCLCASLLGCESSQESVSPGAVGTCGDDCAQACCQDAAPGAVSESADCAQCPSTASPGAVSETSECASQCPSSVSPGAVSETSDCASQCPATASQCSGN